MKNSYNWLNRSILITGGTSGLGEALALKLASHGARIAVVARHQKGLDQLIAKDKNIVPIRGDVTDKSQIHRIFAEAITAIGRIDVLFNNASSLGPTPLRLLLDTECEDLSHVIETNLIGPFRLTKLVIPGMILQGEGLVVNISSDAAINAYPTWGAYGVSKAALDHLTRIFQNELHRTNVKFMAIDPGDMDTPLHRAAVPEADRSSLFSPKDSAVLLIQQIENQVFAPVRRSLR